MKLFLAHCGFYDKDISGGFYESHTNYFIVASDVKEAKKKARIEQRRARKVKDNPISKKEDKMHDIDKPITLEDLDIGNLALVENVWN